MPDTSHSSLCGTILCSPALACCSCQGKDELRCMELHSIGRIVFVENSRNQSCKAKHSLGNDLFCSCPARKPTRLQV